MAIPEDQLRSWARQGATVGSATAYNSVRAGVEGSARLQDQRLQVYLQGSYRNDTNIRGESDVDVVVQCGRTFFYDLDPLSEPVRSRVRESISPAVYGWDEFRADVLSGLTAYYGKNRITDRNKCITVVSAGGAGIDADVVPAFNHRLYVTGDNAPTWIEGMAFRCQRDGRLVVNYPKQHHAEGVKKHQRTNEEFKPTVRIFKNAAAEMVDRVLIYEGNAPSYFIECLVYNVPDEYFVGGTREDQVVSVYNWLEGADKSKFVCVNGVYRLFGPGQWTMDMANRFIGQFAYLWNDG